MKRYIAAAFTILLFISLSAQESVDPKTSTVVLFYNVENLFDTVDDEAPGDEEFTPESLKNWSIERYQKKLKGLAEVIASANKRELPGIVGLAEVENKKVLNDLINTQPLRKGDYKIIHTDSDDERGIDVALLYRPEEFTPVAEKYLKVKFSFDTLDRTRDILYVKGKLDNGELIHIFVNHWPSRSGEAIMSEMKRITAAVEVRKEIDHILNFEPEAKIIVMGDFNDEPTNRSVIQILGAVNKRKNVSNRDLFNLMYDAHNTGNEGTITYKEQWQMFDQIMVTRALTGSAGYTTDLSGGRILKSKLNLITDDVTGISSPFRTYGGNNWLGGVSDHLPVFVILIKEEGK